MAQAPLCTPLASKPADTLLVQIPACRHQPPHPQPFLAPQCHVQPAISPSAKSTHPTRRHEPRLPWLPVGQQSQNRTSGQTVRRKASPPPTQHRNRRALRRPRHVASTAALHPTPERLTTSRVATNNVNDCARDCRRSRKPRCSTVARCHTLNRPPDTCWSRRTLMPERIPCSPARTSSVRAPPIQLPQSLLFASLALSLLNGTNCRFVHSNSRPLILGHRLPVQIRHTDDSLLSPARPSSCPRRFSSQLQN